MRKLAKLLFAVALTMGMGFGVNAQSVKIGHVDSSVIMEIMPERTKIEQDFQTFQTELESQVQTMLMEYQNKVQDYQANQATMSNLIRQSKEKEIIDLETRINDFRSNADAALQSKYLELVSPLIEKVQTAIDQVGKEKGFTYIFDKSSQSGTLVFIGDNAIDITAEVKAKLGL